MHSFSYVGGFSLEGFFTRLRVLTRHPRILFFSFSPVFLFIFHTRGSVRIRWRPEMWRRPQMRRRPEMRRRPDMRDQRWRPEMRRPEMRRRPDTTESPSTGSVGEKSSGLCLDGLPVYREILCPHNTVTIFTFIDTYIPTGKAGSRMGTKRGSSEMYFVFSVLRFFSSVLFQPSI